MPKTPDELSEIPPGAKARIEITVMEDNTMSVNIYPNDSDLAVGIMAAAMDLYGYEATVVAREGGLPSEAIELLHSHDSVVPGVLWTPSTIAMG